MNQWLDGTRSLAVRVASDAGSGLRNGLQGMASTAGKIVDARALRNGSRQVAQVVRRNPVKVAAAVTALVGAGVALWMLRRQREAARHAPTEIQAVRMNGAAKGPIRPMRKAAPHRPRAH